MAEALQGEQLLSYIAQTDGHQTPLQELAINAGYSRLDGKADLTRYYLAVIDANNQRDGDLLEQEVSLTQDGELFSHIRKAIPDLDLDLYQEILDLGIANTKDFDASYAGCFESVNPQADFARHVSDEMGYWNDDNPLMSYVDFQSVWDGHYRYEYTCIADTYFFYDLF
jgi:hypothetical protein